MTPSSAAVRDTTASLGSQGPDEDILGEDAMGACLVVRQAAARPLSLPPPRTR